MEEVVEKAEQGQSAPEDRAAQLGWVPKDEWRGPEEKWIDAETFLAKGEQVLPILRENNRRLEKEVAELKKGMQSFIQHQRKVTESEIAKKIAELRVEKKEALENADYDKVIAIDDDIDQLKEAKKTADAESRQQLDPDVEAFIGRNKEWFGVHADATTDARMFSDQFRRANPDKSIEEELAYVEKKIRKEYPEYFKQEQAKSNVASPVEGGGGPRPSNGKKSFADLPQEAKAEFAGFVRMGAFKDDDAGRKKYAAEYFGN